MSRPAALITHLIGFDDVYTPESFRRKIPAAERPQQPSPIKGESKYLLVYGIPPLDQCDYLISALKAERASRFLIPEMRPQMWGVHAVAPALLAAQCADDSDLGQHDGDFFRPGRNP